MTLRSSIGWCDVTWNPITGCSPISEACQHCYAKRMAYRLRGRFGYPKDEPFKVTFHPDKLKQPLKRKKPSKIFVCSMGDLFHEDVQDVWLDKFLVAITNCPQHTFMVLTKRPQIAYKKFVLHRISKHNYPNLWLGVTVENQKRADERIPLLLQIPAKIRFISIEPILGPINIEQSIYKACRLPESEGWGIDWLILGAETGPQKREPKPEWIKGIVKQCHIAKIPIFMKDNLKPYWKAKLIQQFPE